MVVSTNLSCGHLMSSSKLTIAIQTLIAYYVYQWYLWEPVICQTLLTLQQLNLVCPSNAGMSIYGVNCVVKLILNRVNGVELQTVCLLHPST